jgi:hypothetical protein
MKTGKGYLSSAFARFPENPFRVPSKTTGFTSNTSNLTQTHQIHTRKENKQTKNNKKTNRQSSLMGIFYTVGMGLASKI